MGKTNIYTYVYKKYFCILCGWEGYGKEMKAVEPNIYRGIIEVECPICSYTVANVPLFPSMEETLEYGSEKEIAKARKHKIWLDKVEKSRQIDIAQLPEINNDSIAFSITRVEGELTIKANEIELWRELCTYEYYTRFIEIGKLLKQRYGEKMLDLKPLTRDMYLYGDALEAIEIVEEFRNTLRQK